MKMSKINRLIHFCVMSTADFQALKFHVEKKRARHFFTVPAETFVLECVRVCACERREMENIASVICRGGRERNEDKDKQGARLRDGETRNEHRRALRRLLKQT